MVVYELLERTVEATAAVWTGGYGTWLWTYPQQSYKKNKGANRDATGRFTALETQPTTDIATRRRTAGGSQVNEADSGRLRLGPRGSLIGQRPMVGGSVETLATVKLTENLREPLRPGLRALRSVKSIVDRVEVLSV